MTAFRDHLMDHRTLEAAYLDLVRRGVGSHAVSFHQSARACDPAKRAGRLRRCAFMLRAAELFFRPQRLTVHDGSLIAADEETIAGAQPRTVSPLVSMLGLPAPARSTCSTRSTPTTYWERSDLFDMALDLTAGRRGLAALGDVIKQWIAHLLSIEVEIEPLIELRRTSRSPGMLASMPKPPRSGMRSGTTTSSTSAARERIIGLYRLTFRDAEDRPGQGQGRAHLSDTGDDARPDTAHEAAKSRDRPA